MPGGAAFDELKLCSIKLPLFVFSQSLRSLSQYVAKATEFYNDTVRANGYTFPYLHRFVIF